jgi:hypothetical protein
MDSNKEEKKVPTLNELMFMREQREAAEYEERQVATREASMVRAAKVSARKLRDQRVIEKESKDQIRCNHEKGGNAYKKSPLPEYNIYAHQLPTGKYFIKCRNRCGMRWNQGDTREFLLNRDGQAKLPNHTGQSFEDMWAKLPHDAISRSDVVMAQVGAEAPSAA